MPTNANNLNSLREIIVNTATEPVSGRGDLQPTGQASAAAIALALVYLGDAIRESAPSLEFERHVQQIGLELGEIANAIRSND
jgi:hypothetical protein